MFAGRANRLADFLHLSPPERREAHLVLCSRALEVWQAYIQAQGTIEYVESVVGTQQQVDPQLPPQAFAAARLGLPAPDLARRYLEPLAALQDGDLSFPEPVSFAYYAVYNLFRKYAQAAPVDDGLIVNQALSAAANPKRIPDLLRQAIQSARDSVSRAETVSWRLWYTDLFDRDTPPGLEASGAGLLPGLGLLWQRTLAEGITEDGRRSFSAFHLACDAPFGQVRIDLASELLPTLQQLRALALRPGSDIIARLAQLHANLLSGEPRDTTARQLLQRLGEGDLLAG